MIRESHTSVGDKLMIQRREEVVEALVIELRLEGLDRSVGLQEGRWFLCSLLKTAGVCEVVSA